MGEERLKALLQESLSVATKTEVIKSSELSRVMVDTTVQPKNVTFPTDAKLLNRAREKLVRLAKLAGIDLRQSYTRVGKFALIKHQRYAHAKQFKPARRALKTLRTYLGQVMRDIGRKIAGKPRSWRSLPSCCCWLVASRDQQQHQRGPKVYSLHAAGRRMHRQRQGPSPLRFRREGLRRNHAQPLQRRPVRHPCEGVASQSL
ncbi:hypothetical protein SAMN05216338_107819 [Bradyrhizobium sp. Rc2d]|nr:hypothetical protein SAMN05216338_107819 [Bradyrhizobium sp. Rc2d]